MEIVGIVILNYIFGFLGASVRFIVLNIKNIIFSKKTISFNDIWNNSKRKKSKYDNYVLNVVLGAILFFILATIIIKFNL